MATATAFKRNYSSRTVSNNSVAKPSAPSRSSPSSHGKLLGIFPAPSRMQVWTTALVLWALFVSGAGASFVGSPGVIQAIRLNGLLQTKQAKIAEIQSEIDSLQSRAEVLERSRASQEREIRRVLGYAAADELIFDFSPDEQL